MKGTKILDKVRREVLERDSYEGCPCCIYCGKPLPYGAHLHHVKRRSQGGQGVAENLVTLCNRCHTNLHNGNEIIKNYCNEYLKEKYK